MAFIAAIAAYFLGGASATMTVFGVGCIVVGLVWFFKGCIPVGIEGRKPVAELTGISAKIAGVALCIFGVLMCLYPIHTVCLFGWVDVQDQDQDQVCLSVKW